MCELSHSVIAHLFTPTIRQLKRKGGNITSNSRKCLLQANVMIFSYSYDDYRLIKVNFLISDTKWIKFIRDVVFL